MKELEELTDLFRKLGATEPESWAKSQILEGIPQLHRFLALRQFWQLVVSENDDRWIDNILKDYREHPDAPFSGAGRSIERMLKLGIARTDIVDLVRTMQAELLFGFCYWLEDPSFFGDEYRDLENIGWKLVTTDEDFEPTSVGIGGLHESVLEMDPTGREMRPRPTTE